MSRWTATVARSGFPAREACEIDSDQLMLGAWRRPSVFFQCLKTTLKVLTAKDVNSVSGSVAPHGGTGIGILSPVIIVTPVPPSHPVPTPVGPSLPFGSDFLDWDADDAPMIGKRS